MIKDPKMRAAYKRKWSLLNPERARANKRRWRLQNPNAAKKHTDTQRAKWTTERWAAFLEKCKDYRARNREKVRECQKRYVVANLQKVRECRRKWKQSHPEVVTSHVHVRRARKRLLPAVSCGLRIKELLCYKICYWCPSTLTAVNRTIDHITPLARGGKHVPDNLVAACASCNQLKGKKLYWEWDGELAA